MADELWIFKNLNPECSITKVINTLRPRQDGRHFPGDILKCIFLNENVWISLKISLKFFPKGPINNIPALVLIMAWRRPGDKPLSEPMMVRSLTHICVTRPQWVNSIVIFSVYPEIQAQYNNDQVYTLQQKKLCMVKIAIFFSAKADSLLE